MKTYEELSDKAQQSLENFRKALPSLLKEFEPGYCRLVEGDGKYDWFISKTALWSPPISAVLFGFCLAFEISMVEAIEVVRFARTKNYWLVEALKSSDVII